jgi:uncharacterized protein (DUF924 family)
MSTPDDVIRFWFTETNPSQWFKQDASLDAKIRERFLDTYERAAKGELSEWRKTPEGRLAEVIVLDQFSRNIFRDDPRAFESDALALTLAKEAVKVGDDKKLKATMRHFLYMPYMHSESKEVHTQALRLFLSLPIWKWNALLFEIKHKRLIDQFGRYPSRNKVLGRVSTDAEKKFLGEN